MLDPLPNKVVFWSTENFLSSGNVSTNDTTFEITISWISFLFTILSLHLSLNILLIDSRTKSSECHTFTGRIKLTTAGF